MIRIAVSNLGPRTCKGVSARMIEIGLAQNTEIHDGVDVQGDFMPVHDLQEWWNSVQIFRDELPSGSYLHIQFPRKG